MGIHKHGGDILYEVTDDGQGMSEERIEEILAHTDAQKGGMVKIGIYNINRRIKLIFGEEFGISIESREGEYTTVRVRIPAIEVNESEDSSS